MAKTISFFQELVGETPEEALQAVSEVFEEQVYGDSEADFGAPLNVSWDVSEGTLTFESSPLLCGWDREDDPELLGWLHELVYSVAEGVAESLMDEGEDALSDAVAKAFDVDLW